MKFNSSCTMLIISSFTMFTSSLPLSGSRNELQIARRKAPYSVVPVDGGQPDGVTQPKTEIVTKDSTHTVTEAPKTLPPVTETIISTTVVTESEIPTTIITTITTTSTPIITQAPAPEVSSLISITIATVTSMAPIVETVTIIQTPTLTPYDDGKWHTTYYKLAEPLSSSETSSSVAAIGTASPITDAHSTTFTARPLNGTYALMLRGKNYSKASNITTNETVFTNGTNHTSGIMVTAKTQPPMPTLPKTSDVVNPTQVPSIDVSKYMVPGFGR
jgi:hypothetical protein